MPLPRPTRQTKTEDAVTPETTQQVFRPSDVFRFDPKPDITAEELGFLVSIFWTLDLDYDRFGSLETDLQRHFKPVK